MSLKRLVVLVSGRGSNFAAIADACKRGEIPATVERVVSSRADAPALKLAAERKIPAILVDAKAYPDRNAHEAALLKAIDPANPDYVCLAGYMRLLGDAMFRRYRGKLLNIHPSLLPSFPGLHAQKQALDAGVRLTGCTVHFVTEAMDAGPIILQEPLRIEETDDEASLTARLLLLEHRAYVGALKALCTGKYRIEGNRVRWD